MFHLLGGTYILSNKLSAIVSRDEPKDVVDIWVISKNTPIIWSEMFQAVGSKWVDGKRPSGEQFKADLNEICDAMLKPVSALG